MLGHNMCLSNAPHQFGDFLGFEEPKTASTRVSQSMIVFCEAQLGKS